MGVQALSNKVGEVLLPIQVLENQFLKTHDGKDCHRAVVIRTRYSRVLFFCVGTMVAV